MSRSRKKHPFQAICGGSVSSSKRDKQIASRAARRRFRREIHLATATDFENLLLPHRRECAHNDVWGWNRDGNQVYKVPSPRDFSRYHDAVFGHGCGYLCNDVWPPIWYEQMMRK